MSDGAVVKIFATTQRPDYESPWNAQAPASCTGSGVAIGPGRVLTGAHVVADSTFLQVQRGSNPDKAVGRVLSICHDCDLALLELEDADFFVDVEFPELGGLPRLRDRVSVVGFPIGGDELSITEGVVSRIEVTRYQHSERALLAATVDAAINSGNSGGPVFKNGRIVGIAFQKLMGAEAIGEMVPSPLIEHFLAGARQSSRIGLPDLGIRTSGLENPAQRRWLSLADGDSGVLVLGIGYGSSAWGALEVDDAILAIADNPIANNSTIRYRGRYRTRYDVVLGEKHTGEPLQLDILRAGVRKNVELRLKSTVDLIPRNQYETKPTYFIYAGLVFQPLTQDYLETWHDWWEDAPKEYLHLYCSGQRTAERQEVVVLAQVLADKVNAGYGDRNDESVVSVNGERPRDMRHFVELMESATETVVVRLSTGVIVLEAKTARDANPRILDRYRIENDRSSNLLGG